MPLGLVHLFYKDLLADPNMTFAVAAASLLVVKALHGSVCAAAVFCLLYRATLSAVLCFTVYLP